MEGVAMQQGHKKQVEQILNKLLVKPKLLSVMCSLYDPENVFPHTKQSFSSKQDSPFMCKLYLYIVLQIAHSKVFFNVFLGLYHVVFMLNTKPNGINMTFKSILFCNKKFHKQIGLHKTEKESTKPFNYQRQCFDFLCEM